MYNCLHYWPACASIILSIIIAIIYYVDFKYPFIWFLVNISYNIWRSFSFIITWTILCYHETSFCGYSQQTFQLVFRLIWCRGAGQSQINVEKTLRASMLEFTTFDNVELTLSISTLIWGIVFIFIVVNINICERLKNKPKHFEYAV